ncbi:MAG: hypothetical protein CMP47_13070 [Rickettsiales bacterium]|nr:hypothetical protein [Rickettsiales bacterium]
MRVTDYNSKAREAFGKSLVDIGVSIFKSLILLITVVPITAIFKVTFNDEGKSFSIINLIQDLPPGVYVTLILFIVLAFVFGHFFRTQGLKHIHMSQE